MSIFKFDEINIGDKVTFYSTPQQSNYDEFWEVIGKDDDSLQIKTPTGFEPEEYWNIAVNDVVTCVPASRDEE